MANMIQGYKYGSLEGQFSLPYGLCETAAGTTAKTVTVSPTFSLETGAAVLVKFSAKNSASSPTLNVNGTGAKAIVRYGTTAASTSDATTGWRAGAVLLLIYDGTSWVRQFWENSTYSNMTGATSSAAGSAGLVPAPAAGKQASFLRGDGTWVVPTDTKYTHPSYTAKSSGLYKVTVDATGHVSATTAVAKDDITGLGIPAQDTVYTHPTSAGNKHIPSGGAAGQFLKYSASGTAVWANPYTISSSEPTDTTVIWLKPI